MGISTGKGSNSAAIIKELDRLSREPLPESPKPPKSARVKREQSPTLPPELYRAAQVTPASSQNSGQSDDDYLINKILEAPGEEDQTFCRVALHHVLELRNHSGNLVARELAKLFLEYPVFAAELKASFNEIGFKIISQARSVPSVADEPSLPLPDVPQALEGITPAKIQGYREVSAALSRAYRAQLTPEQAAKESKAGAKRGQASRANMSPEKRAQRNAQEAERQRIKRAAAKAPQP